MSILQKIKNRLSKSNNNEIKRLIAKHLKTDSPIIIEAGAHIGNDTCEMSLIWPKGVIHAFEPVPEIYLKLVANTKRYHNVITYPMALSSKTGKAEIFVSSGNSDGSSSLLAPKEHISEHPDVRFNNKTLIDTITLDQWAHNNRVNHVDFAWLDMQGFELDVLKASNTILKTMKVIYTEVSLKEMYEGAALYPELKEWMRENNFRVEFEDLRWKDMGNVLFIRS